MTSPATPTPDSPRTSFIAPEAMLAHWQGHRRLTRRVIEAFPEEALFGLSVGGMRPFAELVMECIGMGVPTVRGVATGEWSYAKADAPATREELLRHWDAATADIDRLWAQIPAHRFHEVDVAFGQWEGPGHWIILYAIDNEIHHRGQAYVYLRTLGIEPPGFYDRS